MSLEVSTGVRVGLILIKEPDQDGVGQVKED